jgi:hypothetical protein
MTFCTPSSRRGPRSSPTSSNTILRRTCSGVAAGEPLRIPEGGIAPTGHSIEARVYAEDPAKNLLPAPGTISELVFPSGEAIRADSGAETGSGVTLPSGPVATRRSRLLTAQERCRPAPPSSFRRLPPSGRCRQGECKQEHCCRNHRRQQEGGTHAAPDICGDASDQWAERRDGISHGQHHSGGLARTRLWTRFGGKGRRKHQDATDAESRQHGPQEINRRDDRSQEIAKGAGQGDGRRPDERLPEGTRLAGPPGNDQYSWHGRCRKDQHARSRGLLGESRFRMNRRQPRAEQEEHDSLAGIERRGQPHLAAPPWGPSGQSRRRYRHRALGGICRFRREYQPGRADQDADHAPANERAAPSVSERGEHRTCKT